jgi:LacI family transcriptional regulator
MTKKRVVRLADVARRASTSTKTASRVLNGDPRVSNETRHRVIAAMDELGYQVDVLARSLRTGVDETIAVLVPTIGDPFFASIIEEIERATFDLGIKLLVATNSRDPQEEERVIHGLLARRVAGIIVTPFAADYSFIKTVPTPIVFLDRHPAGHTAGAVRVDDVTWAYRAVKHLQDHGHTKIAIVADDPSIETSRLRLQGYRQAMTEVADGGDRRWEVMCCIRADDAREATHGLLTLADPPTAIFSVRSETTVGVVKALHEAKRRDIAVVSFGDFPMAEILEPAVSVIDHSPVGLARLALDRLRLRMEGAAESVDDALLDMTLVERGSGEIAPRGARLLTTSSSAGGGAA